jgi:Indole-3-glycerol phosphate synthase
VLKLDLSNAFLGINNRDLQTFKVDLTNTQKIMESPAGAEVSEDCVRALWRPGAELVSFAFIRSMGKFTCHYVVCRSRRGTF